MTSDMPDTTDRRDGSCAQSCPIERALFLRSTALAALAGIAGTGFFSSAASAQSVGSLSPTHAQGKLLTYAVPARDGALIDAENGVIVARVKNDVYAMSVTCPHRSVTTLEWVPGSNQFHCPRHNAHFQPDGTLIDGRPDRSMDRFALKRSGQSVVVDTSTTLQQDVARDAYAKAFVSAT